MRKKVSLVVSIDTEQADNWEQICKKVEEQISYGQYGIRFIGPGADEDNMRADKASDFDTVVVYKEGQ